MLDKKFETLEERFNKKIEKGDTEVNTLLGNTDSNLQSAEQFRKALQLVAASLTEEQAMEVPMIFDNWEVGKNYTENQIITYGANSVGDPQIYKIVQAHTSQNGWEPTHAPSLYSPIGLDESGYPIWAQPTGAHDAYNTGDIVNFNGTLYKSTVDGNAYSPEAYPAGWEVVTDGN